MIEILVGIASVMVAIGVPTGLFIMAGFRQDISGLRNDITGVHKRIDSHITDFSIHGVRVNQ